MDVSRIIGKEPDNNEYIPGDWVYCMPFLEGAWQGNYGDGITLEADTYVSDYQNTPVLINYLHQVIREYQVSYRSHDDDDGVKFTRIAWLNHSKLFPILDRHLIDCLNKEFRYKKTEAYAQDIITELQRIYKPKKREIRAKDHDDLERQVKLYYKIPLMS